jgi:hypothetical protein
VWTTDEVWFDSRDGAKKFFSLISGFRRDVDEICALLGYYAA